MATTDTKSGKKRPRQVTLDKVGVKCPKLDPAIAERRRKTKKNTRLCAFYRRVIKEDIDALLYVDADDEYKYLKYMSTMITQSDRVYIKELHDSSDEDKSEDEDSDKEESNVKEDDKEREDADE
jgi:hypothetical protein